MHDVVVYPFDLRSYNCNSLFRLKIPNLAEIIKKTNLNYNSLRASSVRKRNYGRGNNLNLATNKMRPRERNVRSDILKSN